MFDDFPVRIPARGLRFSGAQQRAMFSARAINKDGDGRYMLVGGFNPLNLPLVGNLLLILMVNINGYNMVNDSWWLIMIWLVVEPTPLKNHGVRQLGLWHSQHDGKNKKCSKPPTRSNQHVCTRITLLPSSSWIFPRLQGTVSCRGDNSYPTQNPLAQPLGKIFFASGRKADEKRTDHTDWFLETKRLKVWFVNNKIEQWHTAETMAYNAFSIGRESGCCRNTLGKTKCISRDMV